MKNTLSKHSAQPERDEVLTALKTPIRARKKPVAIEALRVPVGETGEERWLSELNISLEERLDMLATWCGGEVIQAEDNAIAIPTSEGTMLARPGDWIIRGVIGEFYPCKSEVFEQTYDLGPSQLDRAADALEEAARRIESLERQQGIANAQNRMIALFELALRPNYGPNNCESADMEGSTSRLRRLAQELKPQSETTVTRRML